MGELRKPKKIPKKLLDIVGVTRGDMQSMNAFFQSAENKKNCEPFEQLNQKYVSLWQRYVDSFDELQKNVENKVHRREYARGGESIHRGFYCPSSMDLVVGNCNRGRLLKRPPSSNNKTYEYLFDSHDRMICVYKFDRSLSDEMNPVAIEFIIYQEEQVLSLIFESFRSRCLSCISACQYESNKLMRYEFALCPLSGKEGCIEINVEAYEYERHLFQSLFRSTYLPSTRLLTTRKYVFSRDEAGDLCTYTAEELCGYKAGLASEKTVYEVRGADRKR